MKKKDPGTPFGPDEYINAAGNFELFYTRNRLDRRPAVLKFFTLLDELMNTTTIRSFSGLPRVWGTQIKSFKAVRPGDKIEIDVESVELMHGLDIYDLQMKHIEDMAASIGCWVKIEEYVWSTDITFKPLHPLIIELENRPALSVTEGIIDSIICFHEN